MRFIVSVWSRFIEDRWLRFFTRFIVCVWSRFIVSVWLRFFTRFIVCVWSRFIVRFIVRWMIKIYWRSMIKIFHKIYCKCMIKIYCKIYCEVNDQYCMCMIKIYWRSMIKILLWDEWSRFIVCVWCPIDHLIQFNGWGDQSILRTMHGKTKNTWGSGEPFIQRRGLCMHCKYNLIAWI